jgi:NAD+ kinase
MDLKAVGIISKPKRDDVCSVAPLLLEWLEQHDIRAAIDEETAGCLDRSDGLPRQEITPRVDLLIVLGGDGTLLAAVRLVNQHRVPILGVNLGYLGFLTEITVDEVCSVLDDILADRHQLSRRTMLEAELVRGGERITTYDALNDVVLHKAAMARIIAMDVSVDAKPTASSSAAPPVPPPTHWQWVGRLCFPAWTPCWSHPSRRTCSPTARW